VLEPGMVMFAHMILMDSETGTAMCLGRTSLTTQAGSEVLNGRDSQLVVR
jgi:Xaa-Pro dipeptidase